MSALADHQVAGAARPQPVVPDLRRPVRARAGRVRLHPDPLVGLAELLRRPQHRHADQFRWSGQLPGHARDSAFRSSLLHVHGVRAVHRADHVRRVARPGLAGEPGPVRQDLLPFGVLPADGLLVRRGVADLEVVDLLRRPVRPDEHRARLVRDRADRLALGDPATVVLAGDRDRADVVAGRLLHDPVPGRAAADLAVALRGRRDRRRDRVEGAALHHLAAIPGDVDRSTAAPADQRVPGLRRVLQLAVQLRAVPAVRATTTRLPVLRGARVRGRTSATAAPAPSSSRC